MKESVMINAKSNVIMIIFLYVQQPIIHILIDVIWIVTQEMNFNMKVNVKKIEKIVNVH